MTASVQDAFPVVEPEPTGPPAPDVSGGSADAGSAATGPDASSLAKELAEVKARLEKLPDDIDARFKSAKDKRLPLADLNLASMSSGSFSRRAFTSANSLARELASGPVAAEPASADPPETSGAGGPVGSGSTTGKASCTLAVILFVLHKYVF